MIELDPSEPSNYTYLSRIYEENGDYEQAEQLLVKARDMKANDPGVYMTLATFYSRQGEFDKSMEALKARAEKEPNNPEAFYTIAQFYWEKAYRDFTISDGDKMKFVVAGNEAIDKAIQLKSDYPEALTYKGLLLRVQANLEKNPTRQQELVKEAATYQREGRRSPGEAARRCCWWPFGRVTSYVTLAFRFRRAALLPGGRPFQLYNRHTFCAVHAPCGRPSQFSLRTSPGARGVHDEVHFSNSRVCCPRSIGVGPPRIRSERDDRDHHRGRER